MGKVVVKALQNGTDHRAHTSFEFGVRGTTQGTNDDGLYWTYKNDIHAQQGEVSLQPPALHIQNC